MLPCDLSTGNPNPINGEPIDKSIKRLKTELRANASSVDTDLGGAKRCVVCESYFKASGVHSTTFLRRIGYRPSLYSNVSSTGAPIT